MFSQKQRSRPKNAGVGSFLKRIKEFTMTSFLSKITLVAMLVLLQACASLTSPIQSPTVKIDSLALGETRGINQSFQIGLLISNPNARSIPVVGMEYSLSLNGFDLLSGVTNQIPTLEAYAETPVTLVASTNALSALRLLNSFAGNPQQGLDYQLKAKLELTDLRLPLNIVEKGSITLER